MWPWNCVSLINRPLLYHCSYLNKYAFDNCLCLIKNVFIVFYTFWHADKYSQSCTKKWCNMLYCVIALVAIQNIKGLSFKNQLW